MSKENRAKVREKEREKERGRPREKEKVKTRKSDKNLIFYFANSLFVVSRGSGKRQNPR